MDTIKDFWWAIIDTEIDAIIEVYISEKVARDVCDDYERVTHHHKVERVRITIDRIKI